MARMSGLFPKIFLGVAVLLSTALIVLSVVRIPLKLAPSEEAIVPYELLSETEPTVEFASAGGNPFFAETERPFSIPTEGVVSLNDETFSAAYEELYDRRDAYYGREIELSGFVMPQEGLEQGGFLVGRNLLWCCSTDNYFIGFLAFFDGRIPAEGESVHVRGTIEAATYTNQETGNVFTVPAIRIASLAPAADVSPMVYPY